MEEEEEDKFIKENPIVFKKYKVKKKLGEGAFGDVYLGQAIENNQYVALKVEQRKIVKPVLGSEAFLLYSIAGIGIPEVKSFGKVKNYNVLVEPLLGKSLFDIFAENHKEMPIEDVCLIGKQVIDRIQWVHSKNIVHRDIKPDNFLIGKKDPNIIYLIDFGLSKKYRSSTTNRHIRFGFTGKLTGTVRFASANALRGGEQSRRDDIESIGYMFVYFLKKKLPWQGITGNKKMERYLKIYKMKKNTTPEELCNGLPPEMVEYISYAKKLEFEQEPDYNFLRKLFSRMLKRKNNNNDQLVFSWIKLTDIPNLKNPINPAIRRDSPQSRIYKKIKSNLEKERNLSYDSDSKNGGYQQTYTNSTSPTTDFKIFDKNNNNNINNYNESDYNQKIDKKINKKLLKVKEGLNTTIANLDVTVDENVVDFENERLKKESRDTGEFTNKNSKGINFNNKRRKKNANNETNNNNESNNNLNNIELKNNNPINNNNEDIKDNSCMEPKDNSNDSEIKNNLDNNELDSDKNNINSELNNNLDNKMSNSSVNQETKENINKKSDNNVINEENIHNNKLMENKNHSAINNKSLTFYYKQINNNNNNVGIESSNIKIKTSNFDGTEFTFSEPIDFKSNNNNAKNLQKNKDYNNNSINNKTNNNSNNNLGNKEEKNGINEENKNNIYALLTGNNKYKKNRNNNKNHIKENNNKNYNKTMNNLNNINLDKIDDNINNIENKDNLDNIDNIKEYLQLTEGNINNNSNDIDNNIHYMSIKNRKNISFILNKSNSKANSNINNNSMNINNMNKNEINNIMNNNNNQKIKKKIMIKRVKKKMMNNNNNNRYNQNTNEINRNFNNNNMNDQHNKEINKTLNYYNNFNNPINFQTFPKDNDSNNDNNNNDDILNQKLNGNNLNEIKIKKEYNSVSKKKIFQTKSINNLNKNKYEIFDEINNDLLDYDHNYKKEKTLEYLRTTTEKKSNKNEMFNIINPENNNNKKQYRGSNYKSFANNKNKYNYGYSNDRNNMKLFPADNNIMENKMNNRSNINNNYFSDGIISKASEEINKKFSNNSNSNNIDSLEQELNKKRYINNIKNKNNNEKNSNVINVANIHDKEEYIKKIGSNENNMNNLKNNNDYINKMSKSQKKNHIVKKTSVTINNKGVNMINKKLSNNQMNQMMNQAMPNNILNNNININSLNNNINNRPQINYQMSGILNDNAQTQYNMNQLNKMGSYTSTIGRANSGLNTQKLMGFLPAQIQQDLNGNINQGINIQYININPNSLNQYGNIQYNILPSNNNNMFGYPQTTNFNF